MIYMIVYDFHCGKSEQKGVRWVVGGGEGSLGRTLREDRTERRVISSPLSIPIVHRFIFLFDDFFIKFLLLFYY